MKKVFLFSIGVLFLFQGCKMTNNPRVIMKQTQKKINGLSTVQYDLTSRVKHFGSADTLIIKASAYCQKTKNDQFMGYRLDLAFPGKNYIYNPPFLYQINPEKNEILKINADKHQAIISNDTLVNEAIFYDLLYPDLYMDSQKEDFVVELLNETNDHWNIKISYPPEPDVDEITKLLRIRKDVFLPDKMTYRVHYKDEIYYKMIEIKQLIVNRPVKEKRFSVDKYIKDYPLNNCIFGNILIY